MHKTSYYIINGITLYRLISAPVLFILLINDQKEIFKWLLAASFFTDAIDGFLARYFKVTSVFGARLDSIADDLTVAVGVAGIIIIYPWFIKEQMMLLILLGVLFLVQVTLALKRYGKLTSFHTYLAKLAAVMQGVFILLLFFMDKPSYLLFYATIGVTALQLIEEIILVLTLKEYRTNVRSLFLVNRGERRK
jgi:CDP-diacylglycerol--glycerol-3-phosphate 3-phosphatidyltransferase